MIVRLNIPDSLFESYEAAQLRLAGKHQFATPEELMVAILDKFRHVDPAARPLVVSSDVRSQLEDILCGAAMPALRDESDLLSGVQRLADLEIGEIRVNFTPIQWQRLRDYASRNELPLQSLVKDVATKTANMVFQGGLGMV